MFILWLKTALFLLSLFVDSHKILSTCDLPGHAVSVLGQSACMNQNSAQVKNNSFFGLEKQRNLISLTPSCILPKGLRDFCGPCRLPVALPDPWESCSNAAPILPASPPHVRLLDCAYENNLYVPVYYFS